jgi:hypothetical protein
VAPRRFAVAQLGEGLTARSPGAARIASGRRASRDFDAARRTKGYSLPDFFEPSGGFPMAAGAALVGIPDRDQFLYERLGSIQTDPRAFRYLIEVAHTYVARDAGIVGLHGLNDLPIRSSLQEIALHNARGRLDEEAGNDLLILALVERYAPGNANLDFYSDAIKIVDRNFPRFSTTLKYRDYQTRLRYVDGLVSQEALLDIASRFHYSNDYNGYYDCICRIAQAEILRDNVDGAAAMLRSALGDLLARGYVTDPIIRRSERHEHDAQIAWLCRALSSAYLRRSELEASDATKAAALAEAARWNSTARGIYIRIGQVHGLASVFRDRGEIGLHREALGETARSDSWIWFARAAALFRAVGDSHHERECRQLETETAAAIIDGKIRFQNGQLEHIIEKSFYKDYSYDNDLLYLKNYENIAASPSTHQGGRPSEIADAIQTNLQRPVRPKRFSEEKILRELRDFLASRGISEDDARAALAITPPPQATATMPDKTLDRLYERYKDRLANIELPAAGFETREQAKAARRLASTYQNLRTRQLQRRLEPEPKHSRVVEAERLAEAFYRNGPKEPAPQGRRRRVAFPSMR